MIISEVAWLDFVCQYHFKTKNLRTLVTSSYLCYYTIILHMSQVVKQCNVHALDA